MTRAACVAALAALITFMANGTAVAATARVDTGTVFYEAGAGETNDLEISEVAGEARLVDSGATITPGPGCTTVTPNEVTCTHPFVLARLLDMSDTAEVVSGDIYASLVGGTGEDTLTVCSTCRGALVGGDGADHLVAGDSFSFILGGSGNDVVEGGDGPDSISGDTGNDLITGGAGADTIAPGLGTDGVDGGPDRDTLRYSSAGGPMLVDLKSGVALGQGPDQFDNVENVIGSRFGDDLRGNGLVNRILGGDGADVLRGRDARDFLFAGGGGDVVYSYDGVLDHVSGGPGFDRAHVDRGLDRVQRVERVY